MRPPCFILNIPKICRCLPPEEIRARFGGSVLLEKEPPASINGTMGSHIFLLKAGSVDELREQSDFILRRADGSGWNG